MLIVNDNRTNWLLGRRATLIGRVANVAFYEDPDRGDEAGLWAVYRGEAVATDWFDLPEPEDVAEHGGPEGFLTVYRN